MTPRQVEALYRDIGKTFARLEPWQIYVLTSAENFERLYDRMILSPFVEDSPEKRALFREALQVILSPEVT